MKFDKDIFISYAHMDNDPIIADQPGWITEFHRALKIMLSQKMGWEPRIWRDTRLQGNDIFDKEIVDQFSNVAIMISVFSPRYINSDWCQKEVNEFYQVCSRGMGFIVNNKTRVFKVIKTPIVRDLQPEYLKTSTGYEFFEMDPNSGSKIELYPFLKENYKATYFLKLSDLVHHISELLGELKASSEKIEITTPIPLPPKTDKPTFNIFLAETTSDNRLVRDNIQRELESHGFTILPQGQLPLESKELTAVLTKCLNESHLSIHLFGNVYGIIPEGSNKSIVELQAEVASSVSKTSKLNRLTWIPRSIETEDEKQLMFLQKLKSGDQTLSGGAELVIDSIEVFKEVIFDKITAMQQKQAPEKTTDIEVSGKMVYVICDPDDREKAKPIRKFFFENGIETTLPIFDDKTDETEKREDHIANLTSCNGAIVIYGDANESWFRSKLRDFDKFSNTREAPFSFKAVFMGPPTSESKTDFMKLGWDIIDGISQDPINELKKILSKL